MTVDEEGFTRLMEEQKERARAARGDMSNAWQGLDLGLDNTPTRFTGYDHLEDDGTQQIQPGLDFFGDERFYHGHRKRTPDHWICHQY